MGLFDSIKCFYPLPFKFKELQHKIDFQTKDLEKFMSNYEISKSGRLYLIEEKWKLLSKKELKKYEGQKFHPILKSRKTGRKIKQNYHGILNFYTSLGDTNSKDYKFINFQAFFTYGKLDKIKLLKQNRPKGKNN